LQQRTVYAKIFFSILRE